MRTPIFLAAALATLALGDLRAEDEFAKTTIDLGCVVADLDASIKFYTEASPVASPCPAILPKSPASPIAKY